MLRKGLYPDFFERVWGEKYPRGVGDNPHIKQTTFFMCIFEKKVFIKNNTETFFYNQIRILKLEELTLHKTCKNFHTYIYKIYLSNINTRVFELKPQFLYDNLQETIYQNARR